MKRWHIYVTVGEGLRPTQRHLDTVDGLEGDTPDTVVDRWLAERPRTFTYLYRRSDFRAWVEPGPKEAA